MPIGFGSVSASAINTELGRSSTATISIDTAENGGYGAINQNSPSRPSSSNPASFSEWQGYDHNFTVLGGDQLCYVAYCANNGRSTGTDCFGEPISIRCLENGEPTNICLDFAQPFSNFFHNGEPCIGSFGDDQLT